MSILKVNYYVSLTSMFNVHSSVNMNYVLMKRIS